ncbi:MAG: iron-sulfur cluster assembly scaffold protein [Victivallales bacterium]|nr:iron-sulfur cluster assembly scaffold protein [Victivallales bacterium]
MSNSEKYFGRMNDPVASAWIKGACGDEMEFYLDIADDILKSVRFHTENGCFDTIAAGEKTAELAEGRTVMDALSISPRQVIDEVKAELSEDGRHCAILAVSTLYKAIADYLLQP